MTIWLPLANVSGCQTSANGLSNMLFYLEIWPDVPPDFHYSLCLQLLINGKRWDDNHLTGSLHLYNFEPGTQQHVAWRQRKMATVWIWSCFTKQVELQRAVQECSETEGGAEEREEDGGGGGGEAGQGGGVHQRLLKILTRLLQEGFASGEGGGTWEGKSHAHTALNFWGGEDGQKPADATPEGEGKKNKKQEGKV